MTSSRARKVAVYLAIASALALAIAAFFTNVERWQYSRRVDCEKQVDARARAICMSIERHLEYTCCGHAIISPGYRSTWATVESVWCEQRIEQKDAVVLRALAKARDWRLSSAADSLLRLLTGRDQYGALESETSILHPANRSYLLKDGCPDKK